MRIVFMGTPEFAVPSLEILINNGYDVVGAVTQPDKPKGRGKKLAPPPVKEFAEKNNIKVLQPNKLRTAEFEKELLELNPELLITVAYGKILPQNILDIPKFGCINVHGSLLPQYRGAAPIHWSIINGEKKTGITTMYTDAGMDTGDMLLSSEIDVGENMTAGELHDILMKLGANVLIDTLKALENKTLNRIPQPKEFTYAPIMKKDIGKINWDSTSKEIHNHVRGTNPWPGAYTFYKGDKMKVWRTTVIDACGMDTYLPGTIVEVTKEGIVVCTGSDFIEINEVQFDSCRKMCVDEYVCGHEIEKGEILG